MYRRTKAWRMETKPKIIALWVAACCWLALVSCGGRPPAVDKAGGPSEKATPKAAGDRQKVASVAPPAGYQALSSPNFRVFARRANAESEAALRVLEAARDELAPQLADAGCSLADAPATVVIVYAHTGDFVAATGRPAWAAAVTQGNTLQTQPLVVLQARRVLAATLRHEYVHAALNWCTRQTVPAPRWLQEGLAIRFAGEGAALDSAGKAPTLPPDQLEKLLAAPPDAATMRLHYADAYRQTQGLVNQHGTTKIWHWAVSGIAP